MPLAFVTATEIAVACNVSGDRARHVLDSRSIAPVGRAGLVRLYPPDTIERVRAELDAQTDRVDRRRANLSPA